MSRWQADVQLLPSWENQHHNHQWPTFLFCSLSMISYGMEFSLCSVQVTCPDCIPSQIVVHPQPTHWLAVWEKENLLVLYKCCSAAAEMLACY